MRIRLPCRYESYWLPGYPRFGLTRLNGPWDGGYPVVRRRWLWLRWPLVLYRWGVDEHDGVFIQLQLPWRVETGRVKHPKWQGGK